MSFCRSATQSLVLYAALAAPVPASAGELGASSHGTVSISVIIPPHVVLKAASAASGRDSGAGAGLCVETNGFSQYHLAIVRHSYGFDEEQVLPQQSATAERPDCISANAVLPRRLSQPEGAAGEALTLLIVAD